MITRPPLRYFGSKWKLARAIVPLFPPHEVYVEPYGGGAAVLLRKSRAPLEVYNDLDGAVVNFFRVLRDPAACAELITAIERTPFAMGELYAVYEAEERGEEFGPVEAARRLAVRSWMARGGGRHQWRSGFRRARKPVNKRGSGATSHAMTWCSLPGALAATARRLKGVQIDHLPALEVIRRYDAPATLFYVDPPYPVCVRGQRWATKAYLHELTDADHEELAATLATVAGYVVLSGIRCEMYDRLYRTWERRDVDHKRDTGEGYVESLWLSPRLAAAPVDLWSGSKAHV